MEKQAKQRRTHILATARRFIDRHGVEGVRMRALAGACGVSVPTLYKTFGGKDALLGEALRSYALGSQLGAVLDAGGFTGHARMLGVLDLCGREMQQRSDAYRRMLGLLVRNSQAGGLSTKLSDQVEVQAARALQEMLRDGSLQDWVDAPALAHRISANTVVVSMEWSRGHENGDVWYAGIVYASCAMLVGVSQGEARQAFETRMRQAQPLARKLSFQSRPPAEQQDDLHDAPLDVATGEIPGETSGTVERPTSD